MATAQEIADLRKAVAEPTAELYDDAALGLIFDTEGSLDAAALQVWTEKAASFAGLVDISEGGSQRKNSDLLKNALQMIDLYTTRVANGVAGRSKLRRLVR
jgi:hypothetical protein